MVEILSSVTTLMVFGCALAYLFSIGVAFLKSKNAGETTSVPGGQYICGAAFGCGISCCLSALWHPQLITAWDKGLVVLVGIAFILISCWAYLKFWEERWIKNCARD